MIKIENVEIMGWRGALRGMRNPKNSWNKSDSAFDENGGLLLIGPNDLKLATSLANAGNEHGKFLRMIHVQADIVCMNGVWWPEFDTYKVGPTRDSCSKMHKVHVKPFEYDDFSHEGIDDVGGITKNVFKNYITACEDVRILFNETGEKKYWRALIEMLPESLNLRATIDLNYQNLRTIYHQRKNHKLDEWHTFCDWVESLPYATKLIVGEE